MPLSATRAKGSPHWPAFSRRPAGARARRGGVHHADRQRLQALPRLCAGARPRHLGARQSRRHGARARPARRSVDASGKPHRRARRQSVSLHGVANLRRPRRHRAKARSRTVGRHALRDQGAAFAEGSRRSARRAARQARCFARLSATPSSTITPTSRKPSSRASRPKPFRPAMSRPGSRTNISICFKARARAEAEYGRRFGSP